ncbi:hypothetical protein WA026_000404 [Henosepilachna vigintioctopunctata]|uniref:SPOC domain-containing protein n=1 Tax=Henosepilachna vigintioctopunctata TaxID=420089 RepID=A0AAW1V432_9CUCU
MDRGSHRTLNNAWSYDGGGGGGGGCAATGGRYNSQNETGYAATAAAATTTTAADSGSTERRGTLDQSTKKKTKSRSGSRSPSPSGSTSSRSPSRYDTPTRPRTSSYSSRSSVAASQITSAIPSPGTPGSVTPRGTTSKTTRIGRFNEYYEGGEITDRHFRSYDEYSQGSAASQDDPYDPDYSYNNHDSPSHLDVLEARSMQSLSTAEHGTVPYGPPDIRNLQKERVHLLEQLEECPSSGDEHIPKKRLKLDLLDNALSTDVIIEANRDHRKVMEVRRLSDVSLKHHSRRPSIDSKHSREITHDRNTYIPHTICKRRKTGGSDNGSRAHHYDHSGSESVGGSRPGTPLCDERPENFPPSEPRRVPRDRDGPLTLPLPRFASQVMGRGSVSVAGIKGQKDTILSSPPPAVTSPRICNPKPSSPVHVPPPASPPPRPPSLSSNSSDSENPPSPSLDERIKSLDEKYEKWSGSRALSAAGGDALAKLDATREKFRLRHKLLDFDLKEVQPSEIVKSVMAKRSVFDEDLKRLENVGEKYEPKELNLFPRTTTAAPSSTSTTPSTTVATIKISSPSTQMPKTPTMLSPRSTGNSMIPAKGLQYPFPSHPPIQTATPTLLPQTPPVTTSTIASPTPQIQTTSTTTRSATLGDNRLKSCASASSDNRISSKVNVNRSVVLNNSTAPIKPLEKTTVNIPSDPCASTASNVNVSVETKVVKTIKHSDKITCRRDSANSPRGDVKIRRNSDIGPRKTDETEKIGDTSLETEQKGERARSEERRKEEQQKEKQRLENERLEKERLEKEQQEKERLEKERLERERQQREKELEKERLEKERLEKEKAEQERLAKERIEREKREREELERQECLRRLREEEERQERERTLREERERKEKEETERKNRELREKLAEEERQMKKERHEIEKIEREKRREEEKKHKDDNHDRRKEEYKHRENHSKEEKEKAIHEIYKRTESHDRNNSEKLKHIDKETEMRRKESIKENRDNNSHEKQKRDDFKDVESRHLSIDSDKSKLDPSKRKERNNSLPTTIGMKRRMSSQDTFDNTSESKRPKLHSDHKKVTDRRDSKDSTRSEDRMKCKIKNNNRSVEEKSSQHEKTNHTREPEEKRREKDKEREEKHRSRQKLEKQTSKSKSREKESRESPTILPKELSDKDFLAKLELRSTEEIEKHKDQRKEAKEKRKQEISESDVDKRDKDDKRNEDKARRDRIIEKNKSRDDQGLRSSDEKSKSQKKDRIRKTTLNSSDNNSDSDEPRKHSIFDIVDDEPAYISMYDKVKARSCKNMQKQEEEKRQEKIKAKFSQLKQSRAKREEKKRSTSWDEDSDSDRERHDKNECKNRRNKMLIASSDDEYFDLDKSHKKREMYTDSDSDRNRQHKSEFTEASDEDFSKQKLCKTPRSSNEISDEEMKKIRAIKTELFSDIECDPSSDQDLKPFKMNDEFHRSIKKERKISKLEDSVEKLDPQSMDSKPPLSEIKSEKINNRHTFIDNSSADESEFKKEKSKKHKKKQKRLKHSLSSEDSSKFESMESSQNECLEKGKHHDKKRQHIKKDKKRDKSKERDKSKKSKRSKSITKSDFKHDGKMENIFGSLSDSSENGLRDSEVSAPKTNNSCIVGYNDENTPSRFSDFEMERTLKVEEVDSKEEHRKRKERRRKEKERRLQDAAAAAALAEAADHFNENSMDFADMGKQLEDNIKDEPVSNNDRNISRNEMNLEANDASRYYEGSIFQDYKKEDRREGREKKKKRKKSKEERQKHHHHHEKTKVKSESKRESSVPQKEETSVQVLQEPKPQSQSLPNLLEIPSPPQQKVSTVPNQSNSILTKELNESPVVPPAPSAPQTTPLSSKEKKREKFIPGFGSDIDETVHENAVKSISEFDTIQLTTQKVEETKLEKAEDMPEEKPRAVISQEETEDAVAALLGESFSNEFEKRYSEDDLNNSNDQSSNLVEEPIVQDDEEMRQAVQSLGASDIEVKPDTPQSEHELQIDTDTEEQDEISSRFDQPTTAEIPDLLQPSKTPDVSNYFRTEESRPTTSLVIKATPNIGSPPSLAPITPQPSIITSIKRNLETVSETLNKMPPLTLPPLIEPARTVISQSWPTKSDESPKIESKLTLVAKVNSPPIQNKLVSPQNSMITNSTMRTYPPMVKISEAQYPPLAAISKPEIISTTVNKQEIPSTALPMLQVSAPTLHNLPARSPVQQKSPSNSTHDGAAKSTTLSKVRLPITSVMVSKPLQATTINLPQAKVAFSSEPPKLIPTQDLRPRMVFQGSNSSVQFPFNSAQKMVVQTNLPVARGLLVPARPGHFNYISSQVAFNINTSDDAIETSKSAPISVSMSQTSPTKVIQMKPQSIIISPNSHMSTAPCIINNQKVVNATISEIPSSLVPISSVSDTSSVVQACVTTYPKLVSSISSVTKEVKQDSLESQEMHNQSKPHDSSILSAKPGIEIVNVSRANDSPAAEVIESPSIVKHEEVEPQQLAIEKVTEELHQTLQKVIDSEIVKPKEENLEEEKSIEVAEIEKTDLENLKTNISDNEDAKIETETSFVKETEKFKENKSDSENVSEISKDFSSTDLPIKDLLDNKEDKEDSDYWSPKDVNIDSVIKTLCSADELSNHSNENEGNKKDCISEEMDLKSSDEQNECQNPAMNTSDTKELDSTKSDSETMDDSMEDSEEKDNASRIGTRRGGRGRGRKGRVGIERGGIQTRRAKVLSKEVQSPAKRGGARGARAKVERKTTKSESDTPTDIYEFREDEENRPRLILTIKQSNTNSAAVQSAVVKEIPKENITPLQPGPKQIDTKEKTEDFAQPSASTNTRKSRRLQEKDITRTTVDDTIEDVIKNTVVTRSNSQATRRSTRQPNASIKPVSEIPRKSPRGRKFGRRTSEANEEILDEKEKLKPEDVTTNIASQDLNTEKINEQLPTDCSSASESVENKQPVIPATQNIVEKSPIGLKAAVLRRIKGEMGQEPMSLIDPVTGLLTPMRECEENKYIPVPGEKKGAGVLVKTGSSVIDVPSSENKTHQTVIATPQQSAPPPVKPQVKPQSLKAHVLSSQAAQAVVTQQVQSPPKQNAVIVSSAAPPMVSMESKANVPMNQNLNVNVSIPNYVPAHISPRTSISLASSSSKPIPDKQPVASPNQIYNILSQQHKQLLQMTKPSPPSVIPKGIVVSTAPIMKHQQPIIKQVSLAKGTMPKVTLPMHLTGAVPSSVLGKSVAQPLVNAGGRLIPGKNAMEPPKVDVSISNLMSVRALSSLSPQGQPRHIPQASMPVPGYEASLAETIPHFPPGSVTLRPPHDLPHPHYMHPSQVMYQQYLRQSYHFPRSSMVPGNIEKSNDGQEGEEAPVTSPPLELRIPGSVGIPLSSRGAAVPHSLHSPHDRATDSPQVGQVYNMQTARMQHYNPNRYYDSPAEPPPAHRPVTSHSSLAALGSDRPPLSHMTALGVPDRPLGSHLSSDRSLGSHLPPDRPLGSHLPPDRPLSGHSALTGHLPLGTPERPSSSHLTPDRLSGHSTPDRPVSAHGLTLSAGLGAAGNLMGAVARHIGADAPTSQRGLQAATPPHASQVPPQAESLFMLLKHYPRMWQGLLALKNDQAAVQMYFVSGNDDVAKCSLPKNTDGSTPPLRIFQRMRLEPPQVEGVARKMQMEKEHCMLLALPCGHDHMDVLKQSTNLTNGFITYLQQKQAAGIVNVAAPGTTQPPAYVVHIFPSCNFVNENLRRIAPSLLERVADIAHLLIVITTV